MKGKIVWPLSLVLLFGFTCQALAYHVTIHNLTNFTATVKCDEERICKLFPCVYTKIPPRTSHTFKTGGWCPSALYGSIETSTGRKDIKLTCLGPQRESVPHGDNSLCGPVCLNSEWTIVQHYDDIWHFRKGYYISHEE